MKNSKMQIPIANWTFNSPKVRFSLVFVKAIWQHLICAIASSNELRVWQKTDRHGHIYWQAYNPTTGNTTSIGSEAEVKLWIEQQYKRSLY